MPRPLGVFVAQTQIQRQLLSQLPVILKVSVVAVTSHQGCRVTNITIGLVWQPKEKRCDCLSAAVHILRIRRRIFGKREVGAEQSVIHVPPVLDIHTHFEKVLSLNSAQTRNGLIGVVWKRESALVDREQTRYVQLRI